MRTNGKKATRLCPCGYLGHYSGKCRCTPDQVARYRGKISGPLLDRIDLLIEVPAVPQDELMRHTTQGEQSSMIRQRTERAREVQILRQHKSNSHLSVKEVEKFCLLDIPSKNLLKQAIDRLNLSARAYHRILRVAFSVWHAPSLTFPIKKKLIQLASLKPFNIGD